MQASIQRGTSVANIWHFESPKNRTRLAFVGEMVFMYAVIIEGDVNVERYRIDCAEVEICVDGKIESLTPAIQVQLKNGSTEWIDFKSIRGRGKTSSKVGHVFHVMGQSSPSVYRVVTDKELIACWILFENWLNLCGMMTRCRHLFLESENEVLLNFVRQKEKIPLTMLLNSEGVDPARMLACVAHALQSGIITAELSNFHLVPTTVLKRWRNE
jgi:hypothetical protein